MQLTLEKIEIMELCIQFEQVYENMELKKNTNMILTLVLQYQQAAKKKGEEKQYALVKKKEKKNMLSGRGCVALLLCCYCYIVALLLCWFRDIVFELVLFGPLMLVLKDTRLIEKSVTVCSCFN